MRDLAVVNASPLIYLSKVNQLSLLRLIASRVIVPHQVFDEIAAKGEATRNAATRQVLANSDWLAVAAAPIPAPNAVIAWDLGAGESAVIATALANPQCAAVIDDALGRKCAKTLGVDLFGTLGLVLIAKQRGHIESARTLLTALRVNGMFLSQDIVEQALALVSE